MPRRYDHLGDVESFVLTIDSGSLSAAAVALGTTPSVISRAITRLEKRLDTQLLRRTTRTLSLTDAGRDYLEQARAAFAVIDNAERNLRGDADEVTGRVRMSVPTSYGHYRLPAKLREFVRRHPRVELELGIANRNVDLVAEGYDVAIRMGPMASSGLVARTLEDAPMCLVAAPDYLDAAGTPAFIADLAGHACLPFVMPSSGRVAPWILSDGGVDIDWNPPDRIRIADDVLGGVSLAISGLGICQTYDFIAERHLRQGGLVEVLPQSRGRSRRFSILYAPHRQLSRAVRALIDAVVDQRNEM